MNRSTPTGSIVYCRHEQRSGVGLVASAFATEKGARYLVSFGRDGSHRSESVIAELSSISAISDRSDLLDVGIDIGSRVVLNTDQQSRYPYMVYATCLSLRHGFMPPTDEPAQLLESLRDRIFLVLGDPLMENGSVVTAATHAVSPSAAESVSRSYRECDPSLGVTNIPNGVDGRCADFYDFGYIPTPEQIRRWAGQFGYKE